MKYFKIIDHDYAEPETFKANTLIINDRRIYAEDYDLDEELEMDVVGAVLTVKFPSGYIRSTNWTFIYDMEMDDIDASDYKDFTRL